MRWWPWRRRRPPSSSAVTDDWHFAAESTLEVLARKYNLDMVKKDLQGPNKRFPAFRDEFFRELTKRLG